MTTYTRAMRERIHVCTTDSAPCMMAGSHSRAFRASRWRHDGRRLRPRTRQHPRRSTPLATSRAAMPGAHQGRQLTITDLPCGSCPYLPEAFLPARDSLHPTSYIPYIQIALSTARIRRAEHRIRILAVAPRAARSTADVRFRRPHTDSANATLSASSTADAALGVGMGSAFCDGRAAAAVAISQGPSSTPCACSLVFRGKPKDAKARAPSEIPTVPQRVRACTASAGSVMPLPSRSFARASVNLNPRSAVLLGAQSCTTTHRS